MTLLMLLFIVWAVGRPLATVLLHGSLIYMDALSSPQTCLHYMNDLFLIINKKIFFLQSG